MMFVLLFQEAKIQIFESNSQLNLNGGGGRGRCFRKQRYKFLKAIHNPRLFGFKKRKVVSGSKDTNF